VSGGARCDAALALLLALGCAGSAGAPAGPGCAVVPVATPELPADVSLRVRMTVVAGGTSSSLEAVARRSGGALVIVGLAPYGPTLFTLRQQGRTLSVEGAASRELGLLPLWVADALHRVYWIRPPAESGADWEREGERIRQRSEAGRLLREFAPSGAAPDSPRVSIQYPAAGGNGVIEIHNPRCGYDARLVTVEGAGPDPRATSEKGG
jgi:hypothetical protein